MMGTPKNTKKHLPILKFTLLVSSFVSLVLWLYLRTSIPASDSSIGNYFALSLSITPFIAGCFGFAIAKGWGGAKSLLGKAILSLSIGLVLWSLGNFVWSYYNLVQHVAAPYPSFADVGYGLGVLFWILSTIYLGRALGVPMMLRKRPALKLVAVGFATVSVAVSYYLFIVIARGGNLGLQSDDMLKAFFDLYYPLTDVCALIAITMVAIVSARYIGGLLRKPALAILLGMTASYIYDLTFSYYTTKETYVNGQFTDIFLLIATVALSVAIVMFGNRAVNLKPED